MYVVVTIGGKQYKVAEKDNIVVEKIDRPVGETVEFDQVVMVRDDKGIKTGSPTVNGAKVSAKVVEQGKEKKIIIFKYKRRNKYRRKRGHRQHYTKLFIEKIAV